MNSTLQQAENSTKSPLVSPKRIKAGDNNGLPSAEDLPTDWIYNESGAKELWNDMEKHESKIVKQENVKNPASEMEEATQRVYEIIRQYEKDDLELRLQIANIQNSGDGQYLDGEQGLLDGKTRMQNILDEHNKNYIRRGEILDDISSWFRGFTSGKSEPDPNAVNQREVDSFDMKILDDLVKDISDHNNSIKSKITNTHNTMIENLVQKVNNFKGIIEKKNEELQLSEMNNSRPTRKEIEQASLILRLQRENLELSYKVHCLQAAFNQINEEKHGTAKMIFGNDGDNFEFIKLPLGRNENSNPEMLGLERKNNLSGEELLRMKDENKYLNSVINQLKGAELDNKKKVDFVEKTNESLEKTIENLKEGGEIYKDFIKDESDSMELLKEKNDEIKRIAQEYEAKIGEINEAIKQLLMKLLRKATNVLNSNYPRS